MRRRRIGRGILWFVVGTIVVLFLLLIAFPFWFPLALKPIAGKYNLHYAKYERIGYNQFALHDVTYEHPRADLSISKAEGFLPLPWYWKASHRGTNESPVFVKVNGWILIVKPSPEKRKEPSTNTVYSIYKKAEHLGALSKQWLPRAEFLNGIIVAEKKEYSFPVAMLENGKLNADGTWPESFAPFTVKANLSGETNYQASFLMSTLDIFAKVQAWETNDLIATKLNGNWKESRLFATAQFGHIGLLPIAAQVRAPDFQIPGQMVKAPDFEMIKGSFSAKWTNNQYKAELTGEAEPRGGTGKKFPTLAFAVNATGDTNKIRLTQTELKGGGTEVALLEPAEVTYKGELLSPETKLRANVRLQDLPWIQARGTLEGTATATRSGKIPDLKLDLAAKKIFAYEYSATNAILKADLHWPELRDLEFSANLTNGGSAHISAVGNVANRSIEKARVDLTGYFPLPGNHTNFSYTNLELHAELHGSLTQLVHSAEARIYRLDLPQLRPLNLEAKWSGTNIALSNFVARVQSGPSVLLLEGTTATTSTSTNLILRNVALFKGDEAELQSRSAAGISFTKTTNDANPRISLQPLTLVGNKKYCSLEGSFSLGGEGRFKGSFENFDPSLFEFFLERSLSGIDFKKFECDLTWGVKPLAGNLSGEFSIAHSSFERMSTKLNLKANQEGLSLDECFISDSAGKVLTAQGFLPVIINPLTKTNRLDWSNREDIRFIASTFPNNHFWEVLTELTKVKFGNPRMELAISGTTTKPAGKLNFDCDALEISKMKRDLPDVTDVRTSITMTETNACIQRLEFKVEDQPLSVTGDLALVKDFWETSRRNFKEYVLEHGNLQMRGTNVQIASFAKFAPQYVVPQGGLSLNLAVLPNRNLNGSIAIRKAATRPIASLGPVDDINADIAFKGREVRISKVNAVLGGETINISGVVDWSEKALAKGYPGLNIKVQGDNLPLARNPNVILRSDLNLLISNSETNIPIIRGEVNLQDSFFLSELQWLVPGKLSRPEKRPPYFSIDRDPVRNWKLDLNVHGVNFMRVNSPFFQGQVSAAFKITGTLEEPTALGEATISSGQVKFPFANLEVRQGLVSLTSENPYLPQVFLLAGARTFGYDVKMEVHGPANEPVIEFSSTPALTSEEIVLMLTTGSLPRSDFAFSNQQKASKLAMFLGKSLWAKFSGDQGGTERLTIRSGEDISDQGRQTYKVEYKLDERWSLVGEYDRFGAVNAGVKWKLFSR